MNARPVKKLTFPYTRPLQVLLCLSMLGTAPGIADAMDVFRTEASVPRTPAGALLAPEQVCEFGPPPAPLDLAEAVNRSLCEHPRTREAWANVKAQAAAVGVARSAYLPTLTASLEDGRNTAHTSVKGYPLLSSSNGSTAYNGSVSATWVLYDFGGRKAALDNAQALLAAARANEDATLRTAFSTVATDYYAAQAAAGTVMLTSEAERIAHDSLVAASARVSLGVAPVSDRLQAQTAYAQSVLNRAKAEGDLQIALGVLATDMNLRPDQSLTLPGVEDGVMPDQAFTESVSAMIDEAQNVHPAVAAARAKLDATIASEVHTRAEGLPSLSLSARYGQNNQPASLGLGEPQFAATGRDWFVGLQLQIPLFEGLSRTYKIAGAHAQIEQQQATLDEAQQQIGLDVWKSYHHLATITENVKGTGSLRDIAQHSFDVSRHRYASGVGSILELLGAQRSLSEAKQQRIQALTDWRAARLQLAAKMGNLNVEDMTRKQLPLP
jgi:outer membrane protein